MTTRTAHRSPWLMGVAAATICTFTLTACSSPSADSAATESTANEFSGVDAELQALLPAEIVEDGVLTIASPFTSPPSIFIDDSGEPTGIAFDVSQEIGALLGVKVEWQELAFPGIIPGLQAGNIDMSMGVIADTAERQGVIDIVDFMNNESALLTQKGNPSNVTDLEDACGLTVGGLAGSHQLSRVQGFSDDCVADGNQPITINEYPSQADGQAAVQSERIAAFFAPYLTLNHVAQTAGSGEVFELGSGFYPDNPFGIALQKDRGTLAEAVRGALAVLVENGTYQEILEQYGSSAAALTSDQVLINGAGTDAFPL